MTTTSPKPGDVSNIIFKSPYICFSMAKQSELWNTVGFEIDINEASKQIALAWEALSAEERITWNIKGENQRKLHIARLRKKGDSRFPGYFADDVRRGMALPFNQFDDKNQEAPLNKRNNQDITLPDLNKKLNTLENSIVRNQPDGLNFQAVGKPSSTEPGANSDQSESANNAIINCDISTSETDRINASGNFSKEKSSYLEESNINQTMQDNDSFDDDEVQIIEPSEMVKNNLSQSKTGLDSELHSKSQVKDKKTNLDDISSSASASGGLSSMMQAGNIQRKEQISASGVQDPQVPFVNFSKRVTAMVAQNSPSYTREQVERIVEGIWQSMSPEERKLYDNPPIQDVYLSETDQRVLPDHNSVNRPNQLSYLDQIRRSESRMMSNYFDQLPHESDASIYLREEQLRRQEALNHVAMLHNPTQHQSLQHQLMSDHFGLHVPRAFPSGVSDELLLLEHDRRRQEELLYYRELNLDPAASRLYSDYDMLGRGNRR